MASQMITAAEVAEIVDCSERYGYMIIKQLNQELEQKGFITMRGRVSRKYFYERTGLMEHGKEVNEDVRTAEIHTGAEPATAGTGAGSCGA